MKKTLVVLALTAFGIAATAPVLAADHLRTEALQVSLVAPQLAPLDGHRLRASGSLLYGNEVLLLDGHRLPFDVADECAGFRYEVPPLSVADLPPQGTAIELTVRVLAQVQRRFSREDATDLAGRCIEGAVLRAAQYLDSQARAAQRAQSWNPPKKTL